jgi:hypothetical protein
VQWLWPAAGARTERITRPVADLQVVEHPHGLDRVGGRDPGVIDHDQLVVIAGFSGRREVALIR